MIDATPITEYALLLSGGGWKLRASGAEEHYPLELWIEHGKRHGGRVAKRVVIVVEDWEEL